MSNAEVRCHFLNMNHRSVDDNGVVLICIEQIQTNHRLHQHNAG